MSKHPTIAEHLADWDRGALCGLHGGRRGLADGDLRDGPDSPVATPPDTYPPIYSPAGKLEVGAAALVGTVAGAVGGAAWVASRRFESSNEAGVARVAADRAHAEKHKATSDQIED